MNASQLPAALRVFLVDHAAAVRQRIALLVGAIRGVAVVGEAEDGQEALAHIRSSQADVVIVDLRLGGFGLRRRLGSRLGSGLLQSVLGGGLFGFSVIFGAAALFLVLLDLLAVFAATCFLGGRQARFFGLAKKALLHFLAAGDVIDRSGARRLGRCRGLGASPLRAGAGGVSGEGGRLGEGRQPESARGGGKRIAPAGWA